MESLRSYYRNFRELGFVDKHEVVGTVAALLLAAAEVALAFVVFRVTVSLQRQANYLQRAQFRMEQNRENAERARVAAMAFGIESPPLRPATDSSKNPGANGTD